MKRFLLLSLLLFQCLSVSLLAADEFWVAVGYGGRRMVSTDGQNWEITAEWAQPGKDDSNNLMGLIYAQGKLVAVGGGGGGKTGGGHVLVSKDGRNWRETWAAPGRINPIVYGNDQFIVGGPRRQLYLSKDAEQWIPVASLDDKRCTHFRQGVFGNGRFVITGNHGGNSEAWISTTRDGKTIDHIEFGIANIRDIEFANGKFVVIGHGVRLVSTDGVHWQSTDLPMGEQLTWVIHTGENFLCGGRKVYSSTDGKVWTEQTVRFRGTPKWTDGQRIISTSWPGKMYFSPDQGQTWQPANELTANGINKVVRSLSE